MEKRCYTVYDFDELSEQAKQKAIEDYRIDGLEYDWWDYIYEDADRIASMMGIEVERKSVPLMSGKTRQDPAIYLTGFSSQGDGACFEGVYRYRKGCVKAVHAYAPTDEHLHRLLRGFTRFKNGTGTGCT